LLGCLIVTLLLLPIILRHRRTVELTKEK
jgi:hypothetical protein